MPPTPKADTKDTKADRADEAREGEEAPIEELSRDAEHSTYTKAPDPKIAEYPPPGPSTIQTLGKPEESSEPLRETEEK